MKKYRLLKDLPGLKAGKIIKVWEEGGGIRIWTLENGNRIEEDKIEQLLDLYDHSFDKLVDDGLFEEIKIKPKSIYELEEGDTYYLVTSIGEVKEKQWTNCEREKKWREMGHIFITKKEAEKESKKRKAISKITQWIIENNIEMGGKVYETGYTLDPSDWYITIEGYEIVKIPWKNLLTVEEYCGDKIRYNALIFNNEKDAKRCLTENIKERKILFDLK